MTTTTLAETAAETAMRAFIDKCVADGLERSAIDAKKASDLLREKLPAGLEEALADAREAIAAGMGGYAAATFTASMRQVGIRAAEAYLNG